MSNIKQRKKTYIITKPTTLPADTVDVDFDDLVATIEQLSTALAPLVVGGAPSDPVARVIARPVCDRAGLQSLVVETSDKLIEQIEQRHGKGVIIEEDEPIFPIDSIPAVYSTLQNFALNDSTETINVKLRVLGRGGEPIEKARVTLSGSLWVDHGLTDARGQVELELMGETETSISLLEIKPASNYWSLRVERPMLSVSSENDVTLRSISDELDNDQGLDIVQSIGWGQKAMGMRPASQTIHSVKIAVIDSGLFADHGDLSPVSGFDFGGTENAAESWRSDGSGHGTHVSGICGAQNNDFGIVGFCPNAEVHGLRVFPNASNAKLIAALDWCIDNDIDVINMSLGGASESPSVRQRLDACRENGILPVAAAGNNGKDVLFPAAFDAVLAVAALGRRGTFPEDSGHQAHVRDKAVHAGEFFVPRFSCRGPEVDVCAPGVAIVSSVPENGYAAWDGTSMACPHVTGFAGSLVQRDATIAKMPRNAGRSQAIFDGVISRCVPLPGVPSSLQGAGLPILDGTPNPVTASSGATLDQLRDLLQSAVQLLERADN